MLHAVAENAFVQTALGSHHHFCRADKSMCCMQLGAASHSLQRQHSDQAAVRGAQGQRACPHDGLLLALEGELVTMQHLTRAIHIAVVLCMFAWMGMLTKLLYEGLKGNGRVLMIACCSPFKLSYILYDVLQRHYTQS